MSQTPLVEAYRLMRSGVLYILIGSVLLVVPLTIAMLLMYIVWPPTLIYSIEYRITTTVIESGQGRATTIAVPGGPHVYMGPHVQALLGLVAAALVSIVVMIIGALLVVIGLWGRFLPGVRRLAEARPTEFSTASRLIELGLLWGIVVFIIGLAILPAAAVAMAPPLALVGLAIMAIGLVLVLVGLVGLLVLSIRLNDLEKNSAYLVAGVLFILGIFLPVLVVVGLIVLYVALGDSIRRAETAGLSPS